MGTKLTELAVKSFGRLDGMVINHGILESKRFQDLDMDSFKKIYDVNVFSCVALVRLFALQFIHTIYTDAAKGQGRTSRATKDQGLHCLGLLRRWRQGVPVLDRLRIFQGRRQLHF